MNLSGESNQMVDLSEYDITKDSSKKGKKIAIMLSILLLVILGGWILLNPYGGIIFGLNENNLQRDSIKAAYETLNEPNEFVGDLTVKGKIIVWDVTTDSKSSCAIPTANRDGKFSNNSPLTLFLILEKGEDVVGTYNDGGKAIQPYAKIGVVYWPELAPVGIYNVFGTSPPSSFYTASYGGDIKGNLEDGIYSWLSRLPGTEVSFEDDLLQVAILLPLGIGVLIALTLAIDVVFFAVYNKMKKSK